MFVQEYTLGKPLAPKAGHQEVAICRGLLKNYDRRPQKMVIEDLAALERLTEDSILEEICIRTKKGSCYTFVGDVLLAVNSNETAIESPGVSSRTNL